MNKHTVCLDPGHGPGNVNGSPDGTYKEWEFTWDMAQRIKPLLEAQGVGVVLTKTADNYPSLTERANISNKAKPDCFVSIHCNSYEDDSVSGLECYYFRSEAGEQLAELISKATDESNIDTREVKEGNFQVLRETVMPSVLIEVGYMTNPEELASLASQSYQQTLAQAIAEGIVEMMEGQPA